MSTSTSPWDDALRRYSAREHTHDDIVTESGVAATQRSENSAVAATGATLLSFDDIVNGDGTSPDKTESLVVPSSLDEVLHDVGVAHGKQGTQNPKNKRSKWRAALTAIVWLIVTSLICGGLYLIYRAHDEAQVEEELPVPAQTYQDEEISTEPVEATDDVLTHEWDVVNADSDQGSNTWEVNTEDYRISTMSIARMASGSVFIPESGIYLELQPSDTFEASNYGDLQTIHVPTNVHRGVWYSAGAPLTASDTGVLTGVRPDSSSSQSSDSVMSGTRSGSEGQESQVRQQVSAQGTTLIASHVAWTKRHRGALYTMATDVKQNQLIWVKGFDGSLSTWRVNGMWFAEHQAFPEDYFSATGPRRLVLTTCGGRVNDYGYYQQNVFLVAEPVALESATQQ
nr:MAG TPA: Sortase [Herelleviridae sp.]